MRNEWRDWFINNIKGRTLNEESRENPSRKYRYTNFGLHEVPFHMEFKSWLGKYANVDEFDMECYHVHVWGQGDHFDEHTDNYKSRMFTYVNELQSSECGNGLLVDGKACDEALMKTNVKHEVTMIGYGERISLTVFLYKPVELL